MSYLDAAAGQQSDERTTGLHEEHLTRNGAVHARLRKAIVLLDRIMAGRRKSASISVLQAATGWPRRVISGLCRDLQRGGVICESSVHRGEWALSRPACAITLEDLYLAVNSAHSRLPQDSSLPAPECNERNINLLLMQATITSNQSFFKALRQFTIDRLGVSAAKGFVDGFRSRQDLNRHYS